MKESVHLYYLLLLFGSIFVTSILIDLDYGIDKTNGKFYFKRCIVKAFGDNRYDDTTNRIFHQKKVYLTIMTILVGMVIGLIQHGVIDFAKFVK